MSVPAGAILRGWNAAEADAAGRPARRAVAAAAACLAMATAMVIGLLVAGGEGAPSGGIPGFPPISPPESGARGLMGSLEDPEMKKIDAVSSVRALSSLAVVQVAVHAAVGSATADNIVNGGDFESVPAGCGTDCHSSCLPSVPGWSSNLGYGADRISHSALCPVSPGPWRPSGGLAAGGQYMLSLQGSFCCGCNNNGWIQQVVTLTPGRTYQLSFDVALDRLDRLRVTAGTAEMLLSGSLVTEQMGWRREHVNFTAGGPSATIRLASESSASSTANAFGGCWEGDGCLLDNVTLIEIPTPVTCADADIYRDAIVNGADLAVLLSYWGPATSAPGSQACDLNKDGSVNGADLSYVLSFWGPCP